MVLAKVFKNGRSQAIRLPKEFRVSGGEVFLQKSDQGFLVLERDPWELFDEGCQEVSDLFFDKRVQPRLEKRDWNM